MTKIFPTTMEGLAACQAFLSSVCESPRPQIIMDEVASNIVRCSGAADFSVDVKVEDGVMTLVFTDAGRSFDPTAVAEPDVKAPAESRPVGGLGLFMVRKLSKSVSYRREGGQNVLTVVMSA